MPAESLPVTVKDFYPIQAGIGIRNIQRLKYTLPEGVNINSGYLQHLIDSIAELGIEAKAFPGCQVLIAKEGNVILNKKLWIPDIRQKFRLCKTMYFTIWLRSRKITAPTSCSYEIVR